VVSVTDPYGRILGFLDRIKYIKDDIIIFKWVLIDPVGCSTRVGSILAQPLHIHTYIHT
jgi:hypothetical protein